MTDLRKEFWDRMEDTRSCMLGLTEGGPLVAMSPQLDDDYQGKIWFITAKGTDLAKAVEARVADARMVVADDKQGLYADVMGSLAHSTDREALDEVWSFVADAWFEGGQHDPDVCLLCFTPQKAQLSITSTSSAKFFYEMAKAKLTDETPDLGAQSTISF